MNLDTQESIDLDEAGHCLCGRPSTEGGAEDESFGLQVYRPCIGTTFYKRRSIFKQSILKKLNP